MLMQRSMVSVGNMKLPPPAPIQPLQPLPATLDAAGETAIGQEAMASVGLDMDGSAL